jgi:hypothetical protein
MPDQPTTPPTPPTDPTPPAPKTQPRGYFNQAQIEDITIADDVHTAAATDEYKAAVAKKDIPAEYIDGLGDFISQARTKMAATGQANSGQQPATLNAEDAERVLITTLQAIQSAAKQRERMEDEDDDPATNFKATGYLIGKRLNPNRGSLLQNSETLLGKARTENLPGYRTPESIKAIEDDIKTYRSATATQKEKDEESEKDRIARDALIRKINSRRMSIQHAIDALYPYTAEPNHPTRRRFKLPTDRPFNG